MCWRILNNDRLKLFTISGFAIVVTDENIHLLIVVHEVVDRGGQDIQGARIVTLACRRRPCLGSKSESISTYKHN